MSRCMLGVMVSLLMFVALEARRMIGSLSKVYAYFTLKKPDPRVR